MEELAEERIALKEALGAIRVAGWLFESDAGARPGSIEDTYLDELEGADLYIGVFWKGYGEYTIDEFEAARNLGKDLLVYEKRSGIEDRDPRLEQFLSEIGAVERGLTVRWFDTPQELGDAVKDDVAAWQTKIVRARLSERPGAPFQAPAVRPGFVPRPSVLAKAKEHLLAEGDALALAALCGMGGSGKSVMATAVANDAEVIDRFGDGILWATLGTEPDVVGLLTGWIQALGDEHAPVSTPALSRQLETLLRERAVLLVLDDVWDAEHASQMIAGGPRCAVLITTREEGIARNSGVAQGDIVEVGGMTESEALAVLAGGEDRDLAHDVRPAALAVADAVGFLPLALALAAVQVGDDIGWDELLEDLRAETARLESLDDPSLDVITDALATSRLSLISSLSLSVRRISRERLEQFAWLGLYPDDVGVTAAMAGTLWDVSPREARNRLRFLRGRSLLLSADPGSSGAPAYALHDTIQALARRLLTAPGDDDAGVLPPGLGSDIAEAHGLLLDRYAAQRTTDEWHTLPNDGYIHNRLVWHLERAGRDEEIHALLRAPAEDGRNAWFTVRESAGDFAGYAADIRRTLEREAATGAAAPRYLRYALMLASLGNVALGIPSALAARMLAAGMWTEDQVRGYAYAAPGPAARVALLAAAAAHSDPARRGPLLLEAYKATLVADPEVRESFGWLVEPLAEHGLVEEALTTARAVKDGDPRAGALAGVIPHAGEDSRADLIAEALQETTGQLFRAAAIEPLLPLLDAEQHRQLLAQTGDMHNIMARDWVVAEILGGLAEIGDPNEALDLAQNITEDVVRAQTLAVIAGHAQEPRRSEAIAAALGLARRIDDDAYMDRVEEAFSDVPTFVALTVRMFLAEPPWRLVLLSSLPPDLAPELATEALELATGADDPEFAARAVAALAGVLADETKADRLALGLEQARAVEYPEPRVRAYTALLPVLPPEVRQQAAAEALTAVAGERLGSRRAQLLAELAPHLSKDLLDDALRMAITLDDAEDRSTALEGLAPHLGGDQLADAVDASRRIGDGDARLLSAAAYAPVVDEDALGLLLEEAAGYEDEYTRARALALTALHLPDSLLARAVEVARAIENPTSVAEVALPAVARRASEPMRAELVGEAVARAAAMNDFERIAWAVEGFRDLLDSDLMEAALDTLIEPSSRFSEEYREFAVARILAAAVPRLEGQARENAVGRALDHAARCDDIRQRRDIITLLAASFDESGWERALAMVAKFPDAYERAMAYSLVIGDAPWQRRPSIFELARADIPDIEGDEFYQAGQRAERVFARLVPYVDPDRAFDLIEQFYEDSWKSTALTAMLETLQKEHFARACDLARSFEPEPRANALRSLATWAEPPETSALLREALSAGAAARTDLWHDDTLAPIAADLAKQPDGQLEAAWGDIRSDLAALPRPELLAKLHALAPVIVGLAGGVAVEAHAAIRDVGVWWQ